MIISDKEIKYFERVVNENPFGAVFHVLQNIHLIIPSGFDEIRLEKDIPLPNIYSDDKIEKDLKVDILNPSKYDDISCGNYAIMRQKILRLRQTKTGAWFSPMGTVQWHNEKFPRISLSPQPFIPNSDNLRIRVDKILDNIKSQTYLPRASALIFPRIWKSPESAPNMPLSSNIKTLLIELKKGEISLSSVKWRDLEEIVAELLRSKGMQVEVTKKTQDGGRDIIARGELFPGEPSVLVAEVKHKPVVGIGDLRQALYANRHFPIVLLATSGRFSAGVIKESYVAENTYRLFLKDGVALMQWIQLYEDAIKKENT